MMALAFGLTAALAWAVHDLLVRRLSQGAPILPLIVVVVAVGAAVLAVPTFAVGGWGRMTAAAAALAAASGLAYVVGAVGLFAAFRIAPVRLVAPVIGAYPAVSLGIAAAQGRDVGGLEWLAVAMVVAGIGLVAVTARDVGEGGSARPARALALAGAASLGFALTFALGQEAARQATELPVIILARIVALAVLVGAALATRSPMATARPVLPVLIGMGCLDALALGLVQSAGKLLHPEYASIASALFGIFTVILARWFLAERVAPMQWVAICTVFAGIGLLSIQ